MAVHAEGRAEAAARVEHKLSTLAPAAWEYGRHCHSAWQKGGVRGVRVALREDVTSLAVRILRDLPLGLPPPAFPPARCRRPVGI